MATQRLKALHLRTARSAIGHSTVRARWRRRRGQRQKPVLLRMTLGTRYPISRLLPATQVGRRFCAARPTRRYHRLARDHISLPYGEVAGIDLDPRRSQQRLGLRLQHLDCAVPARRGRRRPLAAAKVRPYSKTARNCYLDNCFVECGAGDGRHPSAFAFPCRFPARPSILTELLF